MPPPSRDRVASLVREPGEDPVREIWRVLWEQAAPLFRRAPRKLPQPNDRVTRVATTPEARAFAHVLDALGRDDLPAFYFDRKEAAELRIARTSPPTLLAGAGFAETETEMRFALGRALELTQPDHILLATLEPERARTVIGGVLAAFGPADGNGSVDREAAGFAADLWRTIPPRGQTQIRELLASTEHLEDYGPARRAALISGARAGLLACGDLGVALTRLASQRGVTLDSPGALAKLLTEDAVMASLTAFALTGR